MIDNPSYQDFATHDDSAYPELWDGCVGAWAPCLGPSGTRLHDHSGRQNWGTLTSMDAATDWVVDGGKYALDFDGNNDHVALGSYQPLSTSKPFAISAWVRLTSFSNLYPIVAQFRSNIGQVVFAISNDAGYLGMFFGSNNVAWGRWRNNAATGNFVGVWSHVVYAYNGQGSTTAGNFWTYLNGSRLEVQPTPEFGARDAASFIGNERASGGFPWFGLIDEVRVYDRAISLAEVKTLASNRGIAYTPRRRRKAYFGQQFNAAWARGSNQFIQPSLIGVA